MHRVQFTSRMCCAALVTAALACGRASRAPRATIDTGVVEGEWLTAQPTRVAAFRGIPYAASPTGERRWRPPARVERWSDVRPARAFGPACPQSNGLAEYLGRMAVNLGGDSARAAIPLPTDEDCLSLNVWTSDFRSNAAQPVMVWIHGGSGTQGSGRQFEGARLSERGVVVVTINYRLGILGFLTDSALDAEAEHHVSGNYALLDQIAALEWVRANIAAFGGDPTRVTIFGQSAGATLTANLLGSPLARGLFHRAILESGTGFDATDSLHSARRSNQATTLAMSLGVDSAPASRLAALRRKSAREIVDEQERHSERYDATPVIDGWVLRAAPLDVAAHDTSALVPMMIGLNAEEMAALIPPPPSPLPTARYHDLLRRNYRGAADTVFSAYPADSTNVWQTYVRLMTDESFGLETRRFLRALTGRTSVFAYEFSRRPSGNAERFGAYHSAEIAFVFREPAAVDPAWTRADSALADTISLYWARFARDGVPSGTGLPVWAPFTGEREEYLELGTPTRAQARLRRAQYDLLERIQR